MFLPQFLGLATNGRRPGDGRSAMNRLAVIVILTSSVLCNVQCCQVLKRQGAISYYVECDIALYFRKKSNILIRTARGLVDILHASEFFRCHPQNFTFPLQSSDKV